MKLKRWHWIAIAAAILLVVMAPDDESTTGKGVRPSKAATSAPSSTAASADGRSPGRVELELLAKLEKRQQERGKVSDVFNQTSWYVAPPAPVLTAKQKQEAEVPVSAPAPTAPPLPFTYLGRYGDTDGRTVVLAIGEKVYPVKVGDVIDNTYRVEKFSPGMVNLTYLPMNIVQSLRTGEAL
jgi:hypothetical protein